MPDNLAAHGRGLQRRLHRRPAKIRRHALRRPRRVAVAHAAEIELGARHRRAAVPRLADHRRHRLHLRRACDRRPRPRAARRRADPGPLRRRRDHRALLRHRAERGVGAARVRVRPDRGAGGGRVSCRRSKARSVSLRRGSRPHRWLGSAACRRRRGGLRAATRTQPLQARMILTAVVSYACETDADVSRSCTARCAGVTRLVGGHRAGIIQQPGDLNDGEKPTCCSFAWRARRRRPARSTSRIWRRASPPRRATASMRDAR